ncbi:Uncharacterised protein [uncultured archaeon]|nr:Uncharacterised protein [uncultured archaeon]
MDRIVHINNGSLKAKPIVLRLLPGEETIFNLKVVNHGAPSIISLVASDPVFKSVRLKTEEHHVGQEELIPIMVRMPDNKMRLDGEILLTSSTGKSRVPITLVRDSGVLGSDNTNPGLQGDRNLKNNQGSGDSDRDDDYLEDAEDDEQDAAIRDYDRDEEPDNDQEDETLDEESAKGDDDTESEDDAEDADDLFIPKRRKNADDGDDMEPESPRISFSRERDLQRYKSARRPRIIEGISAHRREMQSDEEDSISSDEPVNRRINHTADSSLDPSLDGSRRERRSYEGQIDDDFVPEAEVSRGAGPDSRKLHRLQGSLPGQANSASGFPEANAPLSGVQEEYQGFRQDVDSESREIISQAEESSEEEDVGYEDYDKREGSGILGGFGAETIIPAAIFLALVVVLSMTFIFERIPEFPGALGSSILIVTLIIYGAATLLKA